MPVRDLMRENVTTADPTDSTRRVARQMRDEEVGSVVVVERDRPRGIVTDRDLAVGPYANGTDPDGTPVRAVMTEDPITVTPDTGVFELCDVLCESGVRRMPVVESDETLAGIVTLDDLTVLLADEQRFLADVVSAESPAY